MLSGQLQRKRRLETFEVPACLLSACGINAASHRQGKHQSTSWFTSSKRKPKGLKQGRALRKRIGASDSNAPACPLNEGGVAHRIDMSVSSSSPKMRISAFLSS
mmetsp:Transcript_25744/g.56444  ORF Transcript_25744/g.56444 Transcript_25744/m.56444 type:complete len:104 (+) Transcript_25744:168-479(+)